MEQTATNANGGRHFESLADIRAYKEQLHEQIKADEQSIAKKWDSLFNRNEPVPQNRAQKLMRMLNLGSGMIDGALLGWKLYRKYQEGAFLFGKKKKRKQ